MTSVRLSVTPPRWVAGCALTLALLAPAQAATYVVGASAQLPDGAVRVAQLTDVPWASLAAGSKVIVSAGQYTGPVMINAKGTAAKPITVQADDTANPPVLTDSIDFRHAAWVKLSSVVVASPRFSGVVIRQASHHIAVTDSVVRNAPMGISITEGAGTGHTLARNLVEDSATNGIGVDGVNALASDRTLIQDNTVLRSGHHGMEIRGSNYQIEHNTVAYSGLSQAGTSGIHVFSFSAADDAGDGNLIRYNLTHHNLDSQAHDGNGIQIDQWCDNNVVAFNVSWQNDGAGIIVFDGNGNKVYGNTVGGNGLDPGGTHLAWGEIIVNGEGNAGRPANNLVYDNVAVSTSDNVAAIFVDGWAVARGSNRIGPNLLFNTAPGGLVLRWTETQGYFTAASIDAITGVSGSLVSLPSFADIVHPELDGLRLTAYPGARGKVLKDQLDMLGRTPPAGASFFGAYFTAP